MPFGCDDLHRFALASAEGGAEALMPGHDGVQAVLKCVQIQRARNAHSHGDVVKRGVGLKLIQKPQALLGKRQGERAAIPRPGEDDLFLQRNAAIGQHLLQQLLPPGVEGCVIFDEGREDVGHSGYLGEHG